MKTIVKTFTFFVALSALTLFLYNCSDDESGTSVYTLSGTISLPGGTTADGAIVSLSSSANSANVISKTVTDAEGSYSIIGIEKGTYYMSTTFNPNNSNNLKSANAVILTSKEVEVKIDGDITKDITIEGMLSGGDASVDLADNWTFDGTHSTFEFEFPYDVENAVFTGHFATAGFDVLEFDEATPENTKIKAWVDLVSIETGAPSGICGHGRDGITGCIAGTFGVDLDATDVVVGYCDDGTTKADYPNTTLGEYDLWGDGSATTYKKQSAIIESTGVATFESTSVSAFGNGYMAKGDFTFNGNTSEVTLYFNYIEGYEKATETSTTYYSSFYGWFKFAALDDYTISSGHVGNALVTVKISAQFKKTI